MRKRVDDDMLGRLVAFEKYVAQCFSQTASGRWRGMNAGAIEEYQQSKEYKNYISTVVDYAFNLCGIENGLIKAGSTKQDNALNKDLETLVAQLRGPSARQHLPSPKRQFALVS